MIKIDSYNNVNGLIFGSSEVDAIAVFGEPVSRKTNRESERELHFSDFILRFDAISGGLREVTLLPFCEGMINGDAVFWDDRFLQWLALHDKNLIEVLGFVLSLKVGVAISGFHDDDEAEKAIHMFRYGDWDIFQKNMRPFNQ